MKKIKYFLIACFVFCGCFFSNYTYARISLKKAYVENNFNEDKEAYIDCVCSVFSDLTSGAFNLPEFIMELESCNNEFPEYSNLNSSEIECPGFSDASDDMNRRDINYSRSIRNFRGG